MNPATNNRVLLISPPAHRSSQSISPSYLNSSVAFKYPPLGLMYLAGNLPEGFQCTVLDAASKNLSIEQCLRRVLEDAPLIVGLTTITDHLYACVLLASEIKKHLPECRIVLGGPHATLFPRETVLQPPVDFALTGYAETSFARLAELILRNEAHGAALQGVPGLWWREAGQARQSDTASDPDWVMNALRPPDRGSLDMSDYYTVADSKPMTTMISSRGCPFRCTFCDVPQKDFLTRDMGSIIEEIRQCVALGIEKIHFFDDCFNLKRDRVMEFCNRLLAEGLDIEWSFRGRVTPCDDEMAALLRRAGCTRVQLGIEGTDQETLALIRKNIDLKHVHEAVRIYRRHGILTMGYFIIGFPHQDYEACKRSLEKMLRMGFDYLNMFVLIPYPNTEIYKEALDRGYFQRDHWLDFAANPGPDFELPHWHPKVSRQELERLLAMYYKKFYFSPRFLFAELRRGLSWNALKVKLQVGMSMLRSRR